MRMGACAGERSLDQDTIGARHGLGMAHARRANLIESMEWGRVVCRSPA